MQILDQTFDGKDYAVRVWLDEVKREDGTPDPDAILVYTWGGEVPENTTKEQYEADQLTHAQAYAQQELVNRGLVTSVAPTVVYSNPAAISEQEAAVSNEVAVPIDVS